MKPEVTPEMNPMLAVVQPPNADSVDTGTLELLASWRIQDATDNPEELRAAERELAEFRMAMDESRTRVGEAPLYS